MSIWKGRGEYDFIDYFTEKTNEELTKSSGKIYCSDVEYVDPDDPALKWIRKSIRKKKNPNVLQVGVDMLESRIRYTHQNYNRDKAVFKHVAENWNLRKAISCSV